MLRGEFLRIAAIDFLTFGCGPWDHDFLASHGSELWTMDLTTQPLWNYSVRYVLVLMEVQSRRVVQGAATASPMPAWVKPRIREATPFGSVPRFPTAPPMRLLTSSGSWEACDGSA